MKNKIIFYIASLAVSLLIYPITKFALDKKACENDLAIYKSQEKTVKSINNNNKSQINVIKKKLANNPNRAYREQLLSQIFTD